MRYELRYPGRRRHPAMAGQNRPQRVIIVPGTESWGRR